MLDSKTVFQFQQKVYMITSALGRRPERVVEHWVILFSEIHPKLPVILREMLEGNGNVCVYPQRTKNKE